MSKIDVQLPPNYPFKILRPDTAGIDVGAGEIWVALPDNRSGPKVLKFPPETHGLNDIVKLLKANAISDVAMESTGCYWVPIHDKIVEADIDVSVFDPRSVKAIYGHKTDRHDSKRIRNAHIIGLGNTSFVPPKEVVILRDLVRTRGKLVEEASTDINRMIKTLRLMNVNLERAVSDVTGKTGLSIINAILDGERDPHVLARLRDPRCRKSAHDIALCLDGVYTVHNLFNLQLHRDKFYFVRSKIDELDVMISRQLKAMGQSADPNRADTGGTDGDHDDINDKTLTELLMDLTPNKVDLTLIEGFGEITALTLLSEIGTDMSRWPTVKHFCSWLGLCPGTKISGGKVLSSRTKRVRSRAAWALRMAASTLRNSQSALGDHYRKMRSRQGPQKAITSVAHKLARLVYSLLKNGQEYVSKKIEIDEMKLARRRVDRIAKEAKLYGIAVDIPDDETLRNKVRENMEASRKPAAVATPASKNGPVADPAPVEPKAPVAARQAPTTSPFADSAPVSPEDAVASLQAPTTSHVTIPDPAALEASVTAEKTKAAKRRGRPPKCPSQGTVQMSVTIPAASMTAPQDGPTKASVIGEAAKTVKKRGRPPKPKSPPALASDTGPMLAKGTSHDA